MSWLRLMEEHIKEMESLPAEAPAPVVKKNPVIRLIKEMWPAYLIEIVVIILGITITVAIENWRDVRKEKALEKIYLRNLLTDINEDILSLDSTTIQTTRLLMKGNELFALNTNSTMTAGQVNAGVQAILGRPKFIPHDASFSDLKTSGNLHLLKDIPLKNNLFTYYSQTQVIREDQDAEQSATISIAGPFFLKNFQLGDSLQIHGPALPSTINPAEFKNNVLLRLSNRKELLDMYLKAAGTAQRVKAILLEQVGE